jgi:hypothetical protein
MNLKIALTALALAIAGPAAAVELAAPTGPVILGLSGQIGATNDDGIAEFDLAMLDALDQRVTVTTTPWHEGAQEFSGPLVSTVMAAVGAQGSELRIIAVNDYSAVMPWADIETTPVILATRHNGAEMSLRQHGPIFVIYPFDEQPELRNELYFGRSVWQVTAIEVLP